MRHRIVIEGNKAPLSKWLEDLNVSKETFEGLVNDCLFKRDRKNNTYRLDFVGLAVTRDGSFTALPKFCRARPLPLGSLLRILRHYFTRTASRSLYESVGSDLHYEDESVIRELDAFYALLQWHQLYGVYRNELHDEFLDRGRVHWARTVARSRPVISNDTVFYSEPVLVQKSFNSSLIGSLQLFFTLELGKKIGLTVPADLQAELIATIPLRISPTSPVGSKFYTELVQQERAKVFRADKLTLIDLLLLLLSQKESLSGSQGIRAYGTCAFYSVWEDACRYYFATSEASQSEHLAQPQWTIYKEHSKIEAIAGGEQRPDVILANQNVRAILDAKYYYPFPKNLPGWQDIVKQIYYAESLPLNDFEIVNCFVLPATNGAEFTFGGKVEIKGDNHRSFPTVDVWLLDSFLAFENYILGHSTQSAAFSRLLNSRLGISEVLTDSKGVV